MEVAKKKYYRLPRNIRNMTWACIGYLFGVSATMITVSQSVKSGKPMGLTYYLVGIIILSIAVNFNTNKN